MAQLHSSNDVAQFLQPKIEIIVEEILNGISEWNEKEIDRVVYKKYTPEKYQRTYEFRDNGWDSHITNSSTKEVEGTFEYNPDNIPTVTNGVHAGMYSGVDIRPYLADIIYNGLAGDLFGQGFWTDSRDAWKELKRIVGGVKLKTWITRGAKKAHLKVTDIHINSVFK